MATGGHVGVSNAPENLIAGHVGVSGVPKKLIKGWIGDENNQPKLFYTAEAPHGEQVFTSSGTFTVPSGVSKIDIFCVGGAGGYSKPSFYDEFHDGYSYSHYIGTDDPDGEHSDSYDWCAIGGSGYTATALDVAVTSGETLTVSVGALGTTGNGKQTEILVLDETYTDITPAVATGNGGTSSVKRGSTNLCSANGGYGADTPDEATSSTPTQSQTSKTVKGGNGGSGGWSAGFGYVYYNNSSIRSGSYTRVCGGQHGDDGSDASYYGGYYKNLYNGSENSWTAPSNKLASGQGSTTRAFGESGGTLYDNFNQAGTVIIRW